MAGRYGKLSFEERKQEILAKLKQKGLTEGERTALHLEFTQVTRDEDDADSKTSTTLSLANGVADAKRQKVTQGINQMRQEQDQGHRARQGSADQMRQGQGAGIVSVGSALLLDAGTNLHNLAHKGIVNGGEKVVDGILDMRYGKDSRGREKSLAAYRRRYKKAKNAERPKFGV